MEVTLRKSLEPVNAARDKFESLFERSKFDDDPRVSFTYFQLWSSNGWNYILQNIIQ